MLRLNDAQLDAWIEEHGPLPQGYGEFAKSLDIFDAECLENVARLRRLLDDPTAPRTYFVPGIGISDCPF
jgi:hypothetical protein